MGRTEAQLEEEHASPEGAGGLLVALVSQMGGMDGWKARKGSLDISHKY